MTVSITEAQDLQIRALEVNSKVNDRVISRKGVVKVCDPTKQER